MTRCSVSLADLLPCPFCGSNNIDPAGWMSCQMDGSNKKTRPACDECGGAADSVESWNIRAALRAPNQQVEAVAWQKRWKNDPNSDWIHVWPNHVEAVKNQGWEVRPLYATPPSPQETRRALDVREALEDVKTHQSSWRHALELARDRVPASDDEVDDKSYWEHELRAFDRTFAALSTSPAPAEDGTELCEDCPPRGYPTDKTRCTPCPRSLTSPDPKQAMQDGGQS